MNKNDEEKNYRNGLIPNAISAIKGAPSATTPQPAALAPRYFAPAPDAPKAFGQETIERGIGAARDFVRPAVSVISGEIERTRNAPFLPDSMRSAAPVLSGSSTTATGPMAAAAQVAAPSRLAGQQASAADRLKNILSGSAGVSITPEFLAGIQKSDPPLFEAYKAHLAAQRAQAAPQAAPQGAVAPQPTARNRTGQLAASAAPVISSMAAEPAPGAFDEKTGTYYHGGGMWASDKPLSGDQLQQQQVQADFMRSAEKLAQRLGVPAAAAPIISQFLQGQSGERQAAITGQYGVQGHQISAQAQLGSAGISAGASKYSADTHAAASKYAVDNPNQAQTPHVIGQTVESDPVSGLPMRTLNQYGVFNPKTKQWEPMAPQGAPRSAGPTPQETQAAITRAGTNKQQLGAIAAKLRAAGIDPAQYGLK